MSRPVEYKGYTAAMEVDPEAGTIRGRVFGLRDVITFEGATVAEALGAFRDSVDEYLAFCREVGHTPDRPYSGRVLLRIPPELHRELDMAARSRNVSINSLLTRSVAAIIEDARLAAEGGRVADSPARSQGGLKVKDR